MTLKEVEALIEEENSLKQIAQAYSEIANLKIKRIRAEAERNRKFFAEISYVYGLIKQLAIKKKVAVPKSKKTVSIIITSNYHFYGPINASLIEYYIQQTSNIETDRIIIGKAAIEHFMTNKIFQNYQEVEIKDDQPKPEELKNLVNMIKDYNQVLVFYSKLKTLLQQQPVVSDITATIAESKTNKKNETAFIFEPELGKILIFFDNQILTLLLEAIFLESEVARTASRFISMDSAENEANKFIKDHIKLKSYIRRNLANNKLLEAIAAVKHISYSGGKP